MRRFAAFMLLLGMFAFVAPAAAGIIYCKSDPVVQLNGTLVDISIGIPVQYVPLVNGPIQYTITTPPDMQREVILKDVGYGKGVNVDFEDWGTGREGRVKITVSVPLDESHLDRGVDVPVELTAHPHTGDPVTATGDHDKTTVELSISGSS